MKRADRWTTLIGLTFALLGLVAVGCSSGSSNGGTGVTGSGGGNGGATGSGGSAVDAPAEKPLPTSSGVTASKKLNELTAAEKRMLCDFRAARLGGYGTAIDCGNGTSVGPDSSLDECLGPNGLGGDCAGATAGDYENCAIDTTCDEPQPDSCQPLVDCP